MKQSRKDFFNVFLLVADIGSCQVSLVRGKKKLNLKPEFLTRKKWSNQIDLMEKFYLSHEGKLYLSVNSSSVKTNVHHLLNYNTLIGRKMRILLCLGSNLLYFLISKAIN